MYHSKIYRVAPKSLYHVNKNFVFLENQNRYRKNRFVHLFYPPKQKLDIFDYIHLFKLFTYMFTSSEGLNFFWLNFYWNRALDMKILVLKLYCAPQIDWIYFLKIEIEQAEKKPFLYGEFWILRKANQVD